MNSPTTYEVATIKDIFDKIPVEKLDTFFDELKALIAQAVFVRGGVGDASAVKFPDTITWIDDDKGEIESRYCAQGIDDPFLVIKGTLGK